MPTRRERLAIFILVLFSIFGALIWHSYKLEQKAQEKKEAELQKYLTDVEKGLGDLDIEAKSVSVYNFTLNRKIFAKNDTAILPLASITKLVSVPLSIKIDNSPVRISQNAIRTPQDDKLIPGDIWEKKDLGKLALVVSSNDATMALSENIPFFVQLMNKRAQYLRAKNTTFYNPTGLDIDEQHAGALGTAEDVNWLAYFALHMEPEIIKATTYPRLLVDSKGGHTYDVSNTNTVIRELPPLLLSKTGYTNIAGGNLVVMFKDGNYNEIAVTILGSSYNGRFTDMVKIVNFLYNY